MYHFEADEGQDPLVLLAIFIMQWYQLSRQDDDFKTWEQAARCTADALLAAIHTGVPSANHPFIINYLSEEPTA